jgi:para-aminobenzoate synthetase component 1
MASRVRRYPLVEEIASKAGTTALFEPFRERPYSYFLDSGMDPSRLGRYSFMGSDPFLVLRSRGREITVVTDGREEVRWGNPFDITGEYLDFYALDALDSGLPFNGGAVGYFSYDLCHFIEKLPATTIDDLQLPEMYLCFYDAGLAYDHLENRAFIVSTGFPETEENRRVYRAQERLRELKSLLDSHRKNRHVYKSSRYSSDITLRSNFTQQEYLAAVEAAREYICAGDIFQVNISQRFEAGLDMEPFALYKKLRKINPAPFANYFNFPGVAVVGASPERFLRLQGDLVETRPIKGTRPRGRDREEDAALAAALVASVKDRAEHVMIVDLERNDIGRVCRYGTVKITELAVLETFPTVFHLTSTVTGRLCEGKGRIDLLKATFPGGSITGAPKVRAMEIIDELEPTRRSVYTGSLGYLGYDGTMDLDIVIRTMLIKDGRAYFQVGGGIVYDSEPELEYEETLHKGKALIQALSPGARVAVEYGR